MSALLRSLARMWAFWFLVKIACTLNDAAHPQISGGNYHFYVQTWACMAGILWQFCTEMKDGDR